jgi:hypothetical protein
MEGEVSKSFKLKNDHDLDPVVHSPLKGESAGIVHKQGSILQPGVGSHSPLRLKGRTVVMRIGTIFPMS